MSSLTETFLIRFVLIALACFGLPATSQAACGDRASGDADTFKVTVLKLEMTTDGVSFFTVFEGSTVIDIASVGAGAVAAGLVSGSPLPEGDYTQIRVTTGPTIRIQGYVNNGGNTIYTNGGTDDAGFTANAGVTDTPGGDCAESTFSVPANVQTSLDSIAFTLSKTTSPVIQVAFDTTGTIVTEGAGASVNDPVVTLSTR